MPQQTFTHSAVVIAELKSKIISYQRKYYESVRKRVTAGKLTPARGKALIRQFASNASEENLKLVFGELYKKWAERRVASVSENDWFRLFIQTCENQGFDDPKDD